MRLVFAGTPETAVPSLEALLASGHEVAAVVTRPDGRSGRGRKLVASPVAETAEAAGVEVLKPAKASDPAFLERLREIAPDCCPVVAYGALLRPKALAIPRHGWVNLHFSLLPAWRGAAPVQHAILHGDDVTGAATFQIEEGLDTGPIYGVLTEPILPADTTGDLLGRLAVAGARLLLDTMNGIEAGVLEARPQPDEGVSTAAKLTPDDARVDWTAPAMRVDRLIRACTPAPGAWTTLHGERVKLGPVALAPRDVSLAVERGGPLAPGELRAGKKEVLVGTGTHPVALGEVQPPGKRRMNAVDWTRGHPLTDEDRFS
ncbi:methionyl-tRNA formyltransferase [Spirillospora sp. NPDC047279]|uniref:methionyl-tRNA formyltransferase n=1 Tax=Spirillospora sp. NPDC047279 TaxID=3155478 RepID=UPI0034066636